MNKKLQRELNGPSWTEVILGALLSLCLGVVLAAAFLVLKPVSKVKELPKEPDPKVVYFLEGSQDSGRARQAASKEKAFLQGGSVVLTEDEANTLISPPAKPGAKPAEPPPEKTLSAGSPNVRIRRSLLQVAVPIRLNVYGLQHEIIVQARGGFEKRADVFVFVPNEFLVGSCPLQQLPMVQAMLTKRFIAAVTIPEDLATAWRKLSDVAVEGSTLRLTVP